MDAFCLARSLIITFEHFKFLAKVLTETVPILLTAINNFGIIESIKKMKFLQIRFASAQIDSKGGENDKYLDQ